MKIGILTFHRSINYGAFLQSYALSKFIKSVIPSSDVEVVDFQYQRAYRSYLIGILASTDIWGQYRNYKRYNAFRKALNSLPLSKRFIEKKEEKILDYINSNYNVIISGSDAIFGNRPLPNIYWLTGVDVKHKASYAASAHGRDFNNISKDQLDIMKSTIEPFDYIGVRDCETMKMIKSVNKNTQVFRNCDPSIFLDLNDFENGLVNEQKINIIAPKGKRIIGTMLHDNYINKKIKEKYGHTHMIISLYRYNPYADFYLYDLNPFEWAKVFSKFDLLITKYFHGSIFCLKNNVPVIAIDYSKYVDNYCCKLNDLFSKLELNDYYFKRKNIRSEIEIKHLLDVADSLLFNSKAVREKIFLSIEKEAFYVNSFEHYLKTID